MELLVRDRIGCPAQFRASGSVEQSGDGSNSVRENEGLLGSAAANRLQHRHSTSRGR